MVELEGQKNGTYHRIANSKALHKSNQQRYAAYGITIITFLEMPRYARYDGLIQTSFGPSLHDEGGISSQKPNPRYAPYAKFFYT